MFYKKSKTRRSVSHSKDYKRRPYRHIEVTDEIDRIAKTRIVTVICPLEYPGLTERERRRMYEGLSMVADAFRDADKRCEAIHG